MFKDNPTHVLTIMTPNSMKPGDILESQITDGYEIISVDYKSVEGTTILMCKSVSGDIQIPFEVRYPSKANIRTYVKYNN